MTPTAQKALLLAIHAAIILAFGAGIRWNLISHDIGALFIGAVAGLAFPSTAKMGAK